MTRLFVFLRAINIGRRRLTMERLREIFADMGFEAPETFIARGNVVVKARRGDPARLERRIEKQLSAVLGYEVATFVRTREELAAIAEAMPFGTSPAGEVYVGFLGRAPVAAARDALQELANGVDDFRVEGREVYWLAPNGMGQSTLSATRLERTLGMPMTMRNLNTVHRLLAKYPSAAP